MNPIISNILSRRSIRRFKESQISREELDTIINAGIFAPSGTNTQCYKITAIRNKDKVAELNAAVIKVLNEVNTDAVTDERVLMAVKKAQSPDAQFFFSAPTFMLVSNVIGYTNAMADSCCVLENMMLAANSLGIGTCWINLFTRLNDLAGIREIYTELGIAEDHFVCGCIAVGYPDGAIPEAPARKTNTIHIIE